MKPPDDNNNHSVLAVTMTSHFPHKMVLDIFNIINTFSDTDAVCMEQVTLRWDKNGIEVLSKLV